MGALRVSEVIHVILRSDQSLFLARESDKDQCVMTQLPAQAIEEGGEQYGSCPVVGHAVANAVNLIGVCADQNNLLRFARQHANNVRWKVALKRLLKKIRALASRLGKPFPDQRFAVVVLG